MRRFILCTFVFTAVCWCQDRTSPRPEVIPTNVKVEMPPENFWKRLFEILLPGMVGMSGALIAVWLTNRNNRKTNLENHQHEMQLWSRKHALDSKKEFYTSLITTAYTFQERILRYGAFGYTVRETMNRGERLPADVISQDKLQQGAIESSKLALTSSISLGLILLTGDQFKELEQLNQLAVNLMAEIGETRKTGENSPCYAAFQRQVLKVAVLAKADLSQPT